MLIRVLNFFCVAAMGLTILALYHVSEQTRVARVQLGQVEHRIADERTKMSVLQTEWVRVANPERIQQLAEIFVEHERYGDAAAFLARIAAAPRRRRRAARRCADARGERANAGARTGAARQDRRAHRNVGPT